MRKAALMLLAASTLIAACAPLQDRVRTPSYPGDAAPAERTRPLAPVAEAQPRSNDDDVTFEPLMDALAASLQRFETQPEAHP